MPKGLTAAQLASIPKLTPDQYYFLMGLAFTQSQRYVFGAAEIKYFWVDATAFVPDKAAGQEIGIIVSEVPSFFAEAGPINVDFYAGAALGTALATPLTIPGFNRDANSALAPQLVLSLLNKVPDTPGTKFSEILIPATAQGGQRIGFSSQESLPFVLNQAAPILMAVTNTDGADTDVGIRFNWFEI